MSTDLASLVRSALTRVIDPDLGRPITDVGMVNSVEVTPEGVALIHLVMTVEGCPMRSRIEKEAADAASHVSGLTEVRVTSGTMSEEQRRALVEDLRKRRREVPFNKPGSLTRVIAISSGN